VRPPYHSASCDSVGAGGVRLVRFCTTAYGGLRCVGIVLLPWRQCARQPCCSAPVMMRGRAVFGCSAVQCSAVQCSAVQCSAVQCSAVQCRGVGLETYTDSKDICCRVCGRATALQNNLGNNNQLSSCRVCTVGYGHTFVFHGLPYSNPVAWGVWQGRS
jgi:hypothetical protein